jgi:hypothetical protein
MDGAELGVCGCWRSLRVWLRVSVFALLGYVIFVVGDELKFVLGLH